LAAFLVEVVTGDLLVKRDRTRARQAELQQRKESSRRHAEFELSADVEVVLDQISSADRVQMHVQYVHVG
jgi:hypothetical protein